MVRKLLLKLLPGLLLCLLAGTALAGGIVITLDEQVGTPQAGTPFDVRFSIHSAHDGSLVSGHNPEVRLVNAATGEVVTAPATPAGETGHWVATVTLPAAGEWKWGILPDAGQRESTMVPLTVAAAGAPVVAGGASGTPSTSRLTAQPGMIGLGALAVLAAALVALLSVRRRAAARA